VAVLAIVTGAAVFYNANFDDVLAVARPLMEKKRFTFDLAVEVVNMLKISVDYSEEAHHDSLMRNSNLQMMLSLVNHLGFHGQYKPRSFCGKFAWLALNARNIIILVTLASNNTIMIKEKRSPLDEAGTVSLQRLSTSFLFALSF
jgi:mediator of RNA polymerase II transcription subunit 16, fungi type